jgi:peptide/nickel transport system substrate-binding protein
MWSKRNMFVIFLVLVLLLAGCAQAGTETSAPPSGEEPSGGEAGVEEPAAPAEPSSIVIVIPQDPTGFNGLVTDTGYEQLVGEMVMLAMTEIDPYGEIYTELATEIPTLENGGVVFDEDAWTMDVTWHMRDDVYWADGEQVTVDDLVFTWDAITDPETGMWVDGVDYTDSIEKVDDFTFVVHYNTVYTAYQTQFGGENFEIFPAHYCDASQGFSAWDCNRQPLSDGPYILQDWVTGDHMLFVKNPNYFEPGKPAIDQVVIRIVPESSVRKTMMEQGDADVDMWISPTVIDELKDVSGINVSISPTTRWVLRLFPNLAARGTTDPVASPHPILSDILVRRAIRAAVDVDLLSEQIFRGYSVPVWTEFFRPPYNVCDIPRPVYDPEVARDLLTEAGWTDTDGDGVRECHGCLHGEEGQLMSLEIMTYAEYGEEMELAEQLIGEMLEAVGFNIDLTVVEGPVLWATYDEGGLEQTGNFDLDLWDDGYPGTDPTDNQMWFYYHSDAAIPDYGWNVGRWSNADFDALYDELFYLDEEYRSEVFCQMAQILDEELPQILLLSTVDANAFSARLAGPQSSANDLPTWNIADWTLAE